MRDEDTVRFDWNTVLSFYGKNTSHLMMESTFAAYVS